MKLSDMADVELLERLTDSDLLSGSDARAFGDMLGRINRGDYAKLTKPQRQWAESMYDKLDLQSQEGSENLISSGKYVPTAAERQKKFSWESMPKPLKPPGK